ncbi:outer membrane beta-barrel protein [Bacteroidota bacterium]
MKKSILCLIVILSVQTATAQWAVTPYVGINSTQVKYDAYLKGGNYGLTGIDVEKIFQLREYSLINLSMVTGVCYLANGFNHDFGITVSTLYYNSGNSRLSTNYLQIPVALRLNWQPFALVEGWRIFGGGGITYNYLLKSELSENETVVSQSIGAPQPPPLTVNYKDSGEITEYGPKNSIFLRLEIGMKFKHLQFAYRYSLSLTDMHHAGFESDWDVPLDRSDYISPFDLNGKRIEKYHEFVIGWIIN